jgi:glycosyltransferase 2 family protein
MTPAPDQPDAPGGADDTDDTDGTDGTDLASALAEPPPAAPPRWWTLPLRLLVSGAMLALLVSKVPDFDWSKLVPEWGVENTLWLLAALGLTLLGVVLSALRWQTVLRALGLEAPLRPLLSHYFAGQFVSNVLPTTIGGDVLRVSRLARENGDPPDTFASVVLERLTGWIVLPLITFAGLIVNPDLRSLGHASTVAELVAVGTLIGLAAILVLADHPRLGGRFAESDGWRRFAGALHLGVSRLRRHPVKALEVLVVGLAYQLVLVLAALMAAFALGMPDLGLTVLLAFFPAVLIAQVLPIGISGLGVRESAFVLFLGPLDVPDEQAVALGLLLYLLNLAASLAGAPAFATGGRARPTAAAAG